MNRTDKQALVTQLSERIKGSPNLYLTDFTGLDVENATEFRRRLRATGVEYVVVKNSLMRRALDDNLLGSLDEHLNGPTGLVLAGSEPVAAAKVIADFQNEFALLKIKVGVVEDQVVEATQVAALAKLPSREQMLSQLAGAMQGPLSGLVGSLNGLLYKVVGVFEALKAQREASAS